MRDHRIKAGAKTIAKSLVGDWKEEHLFTLQQARQVYAHYREMIAACDTKIAALLKNFTSQVAAIQTQHAESVREKGGE